MNKQSYIQFKPDAIDIIFISDYHLLDYFTGVIHTVVDDDKLDIIGFNAELSKYGETHYTELIELIKIIKI